MVAPWEQAVGLAGQQLAFRTGRTSPRYRDCYHDNLDRLSSPCPPIEGIHGCHALRVEARSLAVGEMEFELVGWTAGVTLRDDVLESYTHAVE